MTVEHESTAVTIRHSSTLIPYGPANPATGREQMRLPLRFTAHKTLDNGISLSLRCGFNSDQIIVKQVDMARATGTITATDLINVRLQAVVRELAAHFDTNPTPTDVPVDIDLDVARIYWHEHVFWGSPRAAIMEHFGIARTTANARIRAARDKYPLPGSHSG